MALAHHHRTAEQPPPPRVVVGSAVDQDHAVTHTITLADACDATVFAPQLPLRAPSPKHPRFAGHLPTSPGPLAEALQWHDLVLVVGIRDAILDSGMNGMQEQMDALEELAISLAD